jgi:DnaJ like chaperone protein
MKWWGKIIGGALGYTLMGPLGVVLGGAVGHQLDSRRGVRVVHIPHLGKHGRQDNTQAAFFSTTFAVMGHICKADGWVSPDEIEVARKVMNKMAMTTAQRQTATRFFSQGKSPDFPLDETLRRFRENIGNRPDLLRSFVEVQLAVAYADGPLHPSKQRLLSQICERLGLTPLEYQRLERKVRIEVQAARQPEAPPPRGRDSLTAAYATLKVMPSASNDDVKKAYRRQLSQNHPDKLISKDLTGEIVSAATDKTREIRFAYEKIRDSRGFS